MEKLKISIITVSYNSEKTIEDTIKSVISQNYENLDYIIIDGDSTDGTVNIVNKYTEYISTFITEKDKGISDAFNKGIFYAKGEIVGIVNSDDYLLPGALKKVSDEYDGNSDIYCGNILMENMETGFRCREIPSVKFPTMPFFCHVAHQGMFVKKSAYTEFGNYDINIRYPMDLDFLMRAYRLGAKFHHVDYDIGVFRSGGVTHDKLSYKKKDYIMIVRKNGGNLLQAYIFYYYLWVTQVIKRIVNGLMPNLSQSIRYKQV